MSDTPDTPDTPDRPATPPTQPGPPPPWSSGPPGGQPDAAPTRPRWWRDVALVVGTVIVVLAAQAVISGGDDNDDDQEQSTATSAETPTTDAPDDTEPTEPTETTENRVHTANFPDGLWAVDSEIQPGRYVAQNQSAAGCNWERLAGSSGDNVIVSESSVKGQVVVDILPSDGAFHSENCGVWEVYEPRETPAATTVRDGDWVVGEQIEAGTYSVESATGCTWTHASGFEHTAQEVLEVVPAEARPTELFTVTLGAGQRFSTHDCGTWTKTG